MTRAQLLRLMIGSLLVLSGQQVWADIADAPDRTPITGKTTNGEDVLLFPNGRWEYVNTVKAVEAKKVADQFPENKLRPEGAQGGLFGVGRYIMPGDKDYNRRSLSGK